MTILQHIILPDPAISSQNDLYIRAPEQAFDTKHLQVNLAPYQTIQFNTYFNALDIARWHDRTSLKGLSLSITCKGHFELQIHHCLPDQNPQLLVTKHCASVHRSDYFIDISNYIFQRQKGLITFNIIAVKSTVFYAGYFATRQPLYPTKTLAICITTYNRPDALGRFITGFKTFLLTCPFVDQLHLFIINNGQTIIPPSHANITAIENPNYGGSGGFARGLIQAQDANYSHCLFIDDDAVAHMENIHRAFVFLNLAKDPATSLCGAMISTARPWAMWENGAVFHTRCRPLWCGADLRDFNQVQELCTDTRLQNTPHAYGGWWFFAFPVALAKYAPFPFFVRGDDINFSLSNPFKLETLNGVVSLQEDFAEKDSPQTLYLDLRNHLVQHLCLPSQDIGRWKTCWIAWWFILRFCAKCHYETANALIYAWRDVLGGTESFTQNLGHEKRHQHISALIDQEAWHPPTKATRSERRRFDPRRSKYAALFFKYTINGHLLPFYPLFANRITLTPEHRGLLHEVWGAAEITYLQRDSPNQYSVRHSKWAFAKILGQAGMLSLQFLWNYRRLQRHYTNAHPKIAARDFWLRAFDLTPAPSLESPRYATTAP
ncbi:MAG: hypothetical protein COB84_00090 [Rhodobacteraceae bacterium]|nr:MAG: hypothetical protein COB84_00090 [Paracoccaceae bacterium]